MESASASVAHVVPSSLSLHYLAGVRGSADVVRLLLALVQVLRGGEVTVAFVSSSPPPGDAVRALFGDSPTPTLQLGGGSSSGVSIHGPGAIARFLAQAFLPAVQSPPEVLAKVDSIVEACTYCEIRIVSSDHYALRGTLAPSILLEAKAAFYDAHIKDFMGAVESLLATTVLAPLTALSPRGMLHIVGDRLTLADVSVFSTIGFIMRHIYPGVLDKFPRVKIFHDCFEACPWVKGCERY